MTTKEKREHARRPLNIPVDITVQDRFYHGRLKNITKGGVFIKTGGTFSVGQDVSFYFGKEIIIGTIIRVEPQGIGVKFRRLYNTL